MRCGCASDQCACVLLAGANVEVSGTGSQNNPYVISAATEVIIEGGGGGGVDRITGEIVAFGGASAPSGWLICNGQAINRAVYSDLFAVIGTAYGAGDGSTTFNVPDLTGKFPMGSSGSAARGSSGGSDTAAIGVTNLPAHTHSINHDHASFTTGSDGAHSHVLHSSTSGGSNTNRVARGTTDDGDITPMGTNGAHTHSVDVPAFTGTSGSTGSGTPLSILPPYAAVTYIVKT